MMYTNNISLAPSNRPSFGVKIPQNKWFLHELGKTNSPADQVEKAMESIEIIRNVRGDNGIFLVEVFENGLKAFLTDDLRRVKIELAESEHYDWPQFLIQAKEKLEMLTEASKILYNSIITGR